MTVFFQCCSKTLSSELPFYDYFIIQLFYLNDLSVCNVHSIIKLGGIEGV